MRRSPFDVAGTRRSLRSLPADPAAARRELLDTLVGFVGADFGATYALAREGASWRTHAGAVLGPESPRMAWLSAQLEPFPANYDPECPRSDEVGRFRRLPGSAEQTRGYALFYRPFGLTSQLRTLLYDGAEFIAWLGVLRHADRAPLGCAERLALDRVAGAAQDALVTMRRAERAALAGRVPAHLVFDPGGELRFASAEVKDWLDSGRRGQLGELVRHVARGGGRAVRWVSQARASCHRIVGDGGEAFYVNLSAGAAVRVDPTAALSPRRREIAEYAAAGATAKEIAQALGISPHTVRQHLKSVYRQLRVASRLELARVLEDPDARR